MAKAVNEQELFEDAEVVFEEITGIAEDVMDMRVGATVTDGEYIAVIESITPQPTKYTVTEVETIAGVKTEKKVQKEGMIYNFNLRLEDGRTLLDQRFTRDSEDDAVKFQSIRVALGNIATQLGKTEMSMRDLLNDKPKLKIWVSRYNRRRNVNYLQPLAPVSAPVATLNTADAPF